MSMPGMTPVERLNHPLTPPSLRTFLEAVTADPPSAAPVLHATTKRGFPGRAFGGAIVVIPAGTRVRVTDASPFGCFGITQVLDEPKLYQARAGFGELVDFQVQT